MIKVVNIVFQANFVNALVRGLDPIHQKTVRLYPGQIFNGKILKLYPGQLASLQLGGLTLTAKLEAALTAGNRYWFQVQQGDALPVLKVIEGSHQPQNLRGKDHEAIFKQLGIVSSKINELIVQHLAKEELPFTKQHVIQGGQTLQHLGMGNEKGLAILKFLVENNLPVTPAAFTAIQTIGSGQSLAVQIQELFQGLQASQGKEVQELKEFLQRFLSDTTVTVDRHQLIDLLKNVFSENKALSSEALVHLQKIGVIDRKLSAEQLLTHLLEMVKKASASDLKQLWPTMSKEEIITQLATNQTNQLFSKIVVGARNEDLSVTQQLLTTLFSKQLSATTLDRSSEGTLGKKLNLLFQQIGYQYDRSVLQLLQQRTGNTMEKFQQLKGLLLQVQQQQLSSVLQEKVSFIVNRITAQQLLSTSQDGLIANFSVIIPVRLFEKETDLTIQWQGKKERDGKLNPDHCRILFYIQLETLKETIVDVQIQNRIVSLHVINDRTKPLQLISIFQPFLKEALEKHNYQLTSIKWTQPKNSEQRPTSPNSDPLTSYNKTQRGYQGVDIRI